VAVSEVEPSPFTVWKLSIPLMPVKSTEVAGIVPAPAAMMTAPSVTGVMAGALNRHELGLFCAAVVGVTSIGLSASTPRQTMTTVAPP
jgi:hypothetical protein